MKVTMRVWISGTRDGRPWPLPGETVDLPDVEATRLCANGSATPVVEEARTEKAVMPEPEKRGPGRPRKAV